MNPRVTAGFMWPPVNWPANTIAMNKLSDMKMLENRPAMDSTTSYEFRQTRTPYANMEVPMNSKKMILKISMCFTRNSFSL